MTHEIVTRNPATEAVLASYPLADEAGIEHILATAHIAAQAWRTTTTNRRADVLKRVAEIMREKQLRLAQLISAEMGKPITDAVAEIEKCAATCEHYAENGPAMLEPQPIAGLESGTVTYRPLGAILAIMPWNFPFWQVFRFAAPAVMAGNVGILKHAAITTGSALAIEALFREAGLPEGGFQTIIVPDERIADIIADPRIAAVTLTGSERAGASVAAAAGKHLKKTVLELGGSDIFIVCADADLDLAVKTAITSRFQNTGQSCIAAKRFVIDASIYAEFEKRFVKAVEKLFIGNPRDEKTQIGPLARADLRDSVAKQVDRSVEMGAKVLYGGHPLLGTGYFYPPTVLTNVTRDMPVMSEEVFGPVAPLVSVQDIEEAIMIANDSPYGLGSTIFSKDVDRAKRLAARIEAGSVYINGMMRSDARVPFGGIKRSGNGRELGAIGMHEFMNLQSIVVG